VGKAAAAFLLLSRTGFGAAYVVQPQRAVSWVGAPANRPGGRILTRALGARDLALCAGTLNALRRGARQEASIWFLGQAVADAVDLRATWSERGRLKPSQAALGIGMTGISTAAGLVDAREFAGSSA
jgi:hypothetical protein